MKKLEISLSLLHFLLIVTPISYLGFLNQDYFLQASSLHLSLTKPAMMAFSFDTPVLNNGFYWLACLFVGILLAVIYELPVKLRSQKRIKGLNNEIKTFTQEITHLKELVESSKSASQIVNATEESDDSDSNEPSNRTTAPSP